MLKDYGFCKTACKAKAAPQVFYKDFPQFVPTANYPIFANCFLKRTLLYVSYSTNQG
jgi:hypothetical protein